MGHVFQCKKRRPNDATEWYTWGRQKITPSAEIIPKVFYAYMQPENATRKSIENLEGTRFSALSKNKNLFKHTHRQVQPYVHEVSPWTGLVHKLFWAKMELLQKLKELNGHRWRGRRHPPRNHQTCGGCFMLKCTRALRWVLRRGATPMGWEETTAVKTQGTFSAWSYQLQTGNY